MKISLKFQILLFNIFLIFAFLSPTIEVFYLFGYFLLLININSYIKIINFNIKLKILITIIIILSFILNINQTITFKDYLNVFNIFLLIFLFPYFFDKHLIVFNYTILFIVLLILLSQLAFLVNIKPLQELIYLLYEDENSTNEFNRFLNYGRNGGLYYNPNQASKYLTALLPLSISSLKERKFLLLIICLIFFGLFLTGSRTGMLVGLTIVIYDLLIVQKKVLLSFILALCGGVVLFIGSSVTDSRSFQIQDSGSLEYKFDAIFDYLHKVLQNGTTLDLLFGNFTSNFNNLLHRFNLSERFIFGFDSEIGMFISFLGLIFYFLILVFYFRQGVYLQGSSYFLFIIPFILWQFTSTIFFSFKTSLVYMILLGFAVSRVKDRID